MPNRCNTPSVEAYTANITAQAFVSIDPTGDFRVRTTGTIAPAEPILGIAQLGPQAAPGLIQALGGTAPSPPPAATPGNGVLVLFGGDICGIQVGSTSVTAGDLLTNDGNGYAITAAHGSGLYVGAIAFQSGNSGDLIEVMTLVPGVKA